MGLVCPEHAPKPDPRFKHVPLAVFVGGHVKIAFTVLHPEDGRDVVEHVWVKVVRVITKGEPTLMGTIANDFIYRTHYKLGDEVFIGREEIEDWMPPGR